jgi:isoquinoline 1-oxidoreductase alpha subunit
MELIVNGQTKTVKDNPQMPILWVLRNELGLTGTKFGCGVGICGSCAVYIDGQVIRSCITPVSAAEGKEIVTIEGLAAENDQGLQSLHKVQHAFIE